MYLERSIRGYLPGYAWLAVLILSTPSLVQAQMHDVRLVIDPHQVGLQGIVQPGTWTPLRVTLHNEAAQPRQVVCQWMLPDADGDMIYAQRRVTLSPQQTHDAWLYAAPSIATNIKTTWFVRVLDDETSQVLATQKISPINLVRTQHTVVAITGSSMLGLQPYASDATQHEPIMFLRDVDPAWLPDRWHGLSLIQSLIWTPNSTDPASAEISPTTHRAIRHWVRRGGHLVVILPTVGDTWFHCPLSGLLPAVRAHRVHEAPRPAWLGRSNTRRSPQVDYKFFTPLEGVGDEVSVLLKDRDSRALVVARSYGLGRVTLVGVDLTDSRILKQHLPNGPDFWKAVFGWQSPALSDQQIEAEIKRKMIAPSDRRDHHELDRFIPRLIAMQETATPAVLAAIIIFGLYWLAAGPVGYAVLKKRGHTQHSWVAFVAVVLVVSVMTWGGAILMRPQHTHIEHVTILDVDTTHGWMRAHSWLSLFVPRQAKVKLAIPPPGESPDEPSKTPLHESPGSAEVIQESTQTLATAGVDADTNESGFIDSQPYTLQAASPDQAQLPIRATAKQVEIQYMIKTGSSSRYAAGSHWGLTTTGIQVVNARIVGTLRHHLPGPVKNLLLVYCPGDGQTPLVWRRGQPWPADQILDLRKELPATYRLTPLVRRFRYDYDPIKSRYIRKWKDEGHLGFLMGGKKANQPQSPHAQPAQGLPLATDQLVHAIEMLSFYSLLPPPDFRMMEFYPRVANYDRALARSLDLSPLTAMRRLILIGHVEEAPIPVPLTVDGQTSPSDGWTVVRWICPIE